MMLLMALVLPQVDPALPEYRRVEGISGNISVLPFGDALNNVITYWGERFARFYPSSSVQMEGKCLDDVPRWGKALATGYWDFAPLGRAPREQEVAAFRKEFGRELRAFRVAADALVVIVHPDNPLRSLSLEQVDAAFSKRRRRGGPEAKTWGDLGATGAWSKRPLVLVGRNSASASCALFQDIVLKNGDFKDEVKEQPGAASVVLAVSQDPAAVGYAGLGSEMAGVRPLPLGGATPVEATATSVLDGTYPLARFLYLGVDVGPEKPLRPVVREFLRLVLSKEGQTEVAKDGRVPLPERIAAEERKKLE
jgi:phosphate transport system substrate-binding protein